MDCIFCKIIKGEIPSARVFENDKVYAFRDINPQAPVHVLIVPKTHVPSADAIAARNSDLVAAIFEAIPEIAKSEGLTNGYRIITNCGEDGCQTVKHLHFHLLGGKRLSEEMV
ncbi:MAG: histidine triad nucleotide-binding protein [Clostridia bacterium]|nr:histidine triad nucleotide-binding protein [Clostridia bacterium]